jgi:hypothetical protein
MYRRLAVRLAVLAAGVALAGAAFLIHMRPASACGCFTPPDPSVPIVQAGERIAFQIKDGKVTAHIQIQYSGPAEEFGWLLPLPSEPTLEVGTDELFVQLIQQTQPLYRLIPEYEGNCSFDPSRGGPTNDNAGGGDDGGDSASPEEDGNPLVFRDTVGPYDYAVLRADSKEPMLEWLDDNGFFVPAGTDEAVDPYIRPGAFFLALKLLKGNDVGDIQPVVVEYESDLPMIPIVLTGVAADPDMPVLVWVLGEHRAIPRNFFHTEINDAELNWLGAADNYIEVITKAVDEADGHHSFVTEFAGSSSVMVDVLDYPDRFGDLNELRSITDAINYVEYLSYNGFTTSALTPPAFATSYTNQVLAVLQKHLPVPPKLLEVLVGNPNDYYLNIRYYLDFLRMESPELFEGLDLEFDPVAMTDELEERVVTPSLAAGELFRENRYLSRLFTTLSPNEMTRDPVFSFNPDLKDVSNVHEGRLIYYCGIVPNDSPTTTPAKIITESGWELALPDGTQKNPWVDVNWPKSQFILVDREEGDSELVVDNTARIAKIIDQRSGDGGGCSSSGRDGAGLGLCLGLLFALRLASRRRAR